VCAVLLLAAVGAPAATYQTLYSFSRYDAAWPVAGLTIDQYGNLYGVAPWGENTEGWIFELSSSQGRWSLHVLREFDMRDPEGAGPLGGMVMDEAGNLYGTTSYDHGEFECGTVFKIPPSHDYTVLHFFNCADGYKPEATLTYSNGWLWGTTRGGGSKGQGTVFSLDTDGDYFTFHSFSGLRGREPLSAFNLWGYGTTYSGGWKGKGNIYRLDPVKGLINKHGFTIDGKAGYAPMGDLLTLNVGGVRTIYGTTSAGGVGGGGTVYRLTEIEPNSDRWAIKVLHSFSSGDTQGWAPLAGLTPDSAGNLYGTASKGGDCGTVFELSPGKADKWVYTVVYSFDIYNGDGCYPTASVVFDKAGNLYGTTYYGGDSYSGVVYEITP
jgi:uncharacterized repeat protein (TIGR03803 family)